jgi:hypothetical protein
MRIVLMGTAAAMLALVPAAALRAQGADTTGAGQSAPPAAPQRLVLCSNSTTQNVLCGVRIANVIDGGTFIELQDGTLWEVYLPNRPATVTWRKGDYVLVQRNPLARGAFDFMLVNGRVGYYDNKDTQAFVRFRGMAPEAPGR